MAGVATANHEVEKHQVKDYNTNNEGDEDIVENEITTTKYITPIKFSVHHSADTSSPLMVTKLACTSSDRIVWHIQTIYPNNS